MNSSMSLHGLQERVLILAPLPRDVEIMIQLLLSQGIVGVACSNLSDLCDKLEAGAAAFVIVDEDLLCDPQSRLSTLLRNQPTWSQIPIITLTELSNDLQARASEFPVGVTILECPVRLRTFASVVQSAVQARQAQYALRDSLATREEQAKALRRSEEALRQTDRMKDEFIATLAHELRNPLAPIRTGLQILHISPSGESATRALAIMERQVTSMVRLIDDLLDISRISRGRLDMRREEVSLSSVIDRALEATKPYMESARHTLTVSLPKEEVILYADPMRLAQLISNILTNAAKYTPHEGRITVRAHCVDGLLTIDVIDNGIGISSEMIPRVFDMFSQVSRSLDKSQGGLGIGLALSRRLAELHGGTLEASSAGIGTGSTFTLKLPCKDTAGHPMLPRDGA